MLEFILMKQTTYLQILVFCGLENHLKMAF